MFRRASLAVNAKPVVVAEDNYTFSVDNALAAVSDKIVNDCISGQSSFGDEKKNAAVTLYARYLKRVGGHLKNITTTMLNPYEYIGYNSPK